MINWLKKHIKTISLIWFLLQGILLLLNEIRVYFEHNYLMYSFLIVSICLIVVSLLLFVKNKKIITVLIVLLFLYSIVALCFMGLLFFMEAHGHIFLNIFLCFVIPMLNILLLTLLIRFGNLSQLEL